MTCMDQSARAIRATVTLLWLVVAVLVMEREMGAQNPALASPKSTRQAVTTEAQTPALDPKAAQTLRDAAKMGFPLSTETVNDNVSVEAVLLPATVCKRVFGKGIANSYAAVELTISNKSSEQSMLVHSVFIDYSDWALSGSQYLSRGNDLPGERQSPGHNPVHSWQAQTIPNQISSVEYRVARGELLDAQNWTTRNWVMRALTVAGAIATAYSFSISEQGIIRGIAAFSGQVVPAAQTFWPDETVGQMNRISDLGFQTNKVIAKNSSDIIVAFFPIDRFLTPGLKKLFLKSPALFFSPYALIFDPNAKKDLQIILEPLLKPAGSRTGKDGCKSGGKFDISQLPLVYMDDYVASLDTKQSGQSSRAAPDTKVAEAAPSPCELSKDEYKKIIKFLAHASLNTMRIIVGGEMMVNVDRIPASIVSISFDQGNNKSETWNIGEHTGVIIGNFLTGGALSVDQAKEIGNPTFTVDEQKSTEHELHFSMKLTQEIKTQTQLTFRVNKKDKEGNPVAGIPFTMVVQYTAAEQNKKPDNNKPATPAGDASSQSASGPFSSGLEQS